MSAEPMTEKVMASARTVVFIAAMRVAVADFWAARTEAWADTMAEDAVAALC